jgi:hypothetical protein
VGQDPSRTSVTTHATELDTNSLSYYRRGMRTVIAFKLFSRLVDGRLSEDERRELAAFLATRPDAGDLIPGAGGVRTFVGLRTRVVRKLRWEASGKGKSGGARVITYWHCDGCSLYLITPYLKRERANLSPSEITWLYWAAKDLADAHQKHP